MSIEQLEAANETAFSSDSAGPHHHHEDPREATDPGLAGVVVIDRWAHDVRVEGRSVKLTAKEFALLTFLCERRGQALSREQVLDKVWGANYHGGRRTVDVHVRRLRAKLRGHLPLDTLRGVGYRLRADAPLATE